MAQIRFLRISTSQPSQFPNNNVSTIMSLKNLRRERATWRRGGGESLLWWAIFISRQFSIEICAVLLTPDLIICQHILSILLFVLISTSTLPKLFITFKRSHISAIGAAGCMWRGWELGGGKLCCKQLGNIKIFFTLRQNADSHAELSQHLYLTRNRKPHSWSRQRYTTLN